MNTGKDSKGKNTPDNTNCGYINIVAITPTLSCVFAKLPNEKPKVKNIRIPNTITKYKLKILPTTFTSNINKAKLKIILN